MNFVNFLNDPTIFNRLLDQTRLIDEIYKAISEMDMSAAVMSALKAMRVTGTVPFIPSSQKSSDKSDTFRNRGNTFYTSEQYHEALECYNQALLVAPKGSTQLLHGYSNRSALLVKIGAYSACLKDIDTCLKLGCSSKLEKKLTQRRDQCNIRLWGELFRNEVMKGTFSREFFEFNVKRNPEVPCLSADVDIVSESGEWKVVAGKDIKVGSLLAVETAYTAFSPKNRSFTSCYYCQKLTFNLIPCENCCYVLFCNDTCKELCYKEYHHIECVIMDVLNILNAGYKFRLTVKTVLKLKTQCKTWSALISESKNIGADRLKKSTVNQIFDGNNVSSILSFKEDRHFVHGPLYNNCFLYAMIVDHLEGVTGFYPGTPSSFIEAQKCIAKLLITLDLMWVFIPEMENAADQLQLNRIGFNAPQHFGILPCIGKLKHSCEPNVLLIGLDRQAALVAIRPIKKMTELKVSYVGHWYDHLYSVKQRACKIYDTTFNTCRCRVCVESWNVFKFLNGPLNELQTKTVNSFNSIVREVQIPPQDAEYFEETCRVLAVLDDAIHSKEHHGVFSQLRNQISLCQFAYTSNSIVGKIDDTVEE